MQQEKPFEMCDGTMCRADIFINEKGKPDVERVYFPDGQALPGALLRPCDAAFILQQWTAQYETPAGPGPEDDPDGDEEDESDRVEAPRAMRRPILHARSGSPPAAPAAL